MLELENDKTVKCFGNPCRRGFESHDVHMLRGCIVLCKTSPTSCHGVRMCERIFGDNALCTTKYVDPIFAPLLYAAKAYLDGQAVAIRFNAIDLFHSLIQQLI